MDISKHILIIGGYGKAGTNIAKLLVKNSNHAITLAGRNSWKAKKIAKEINKEFHSNQTYGLELDITNVQKLREMLSLYDILIVCLPFPEKSTEIVKTIANSDVNYIDLSPNETKNRHFKRYNYLLKSQGRVCLLESGWEPGLPALLVRLANDKLDGKAKDITIYAVYRDRNMPLGSITDIVEHAKFEQKIFVENKWQKTSILNTTNMPLPTPYGDITGFPTELAELKYLPKKLNINSLKLYQGGYNWLSDIILFLWMILGLRKNPYLLEQGVKLFQLGNQKFTKPNSAGLIQVMAYNNGKSVKVTASNKNLYRATAIPVVASVLLLDQGAVASGVGFMGHRIPPQKMADLIKDLGISMSVDSKL